MNGEETEVKELTLQAVEVPSDALEIIHARNKLWDQVMSVAIKSTGNGDWVDQNGKPYLQASGSEKVARRFGVRLFDLTYEREDLEDDRGKYYLYTVLGKAALGSSAADVIEAIGTCSSRDKFFGKKDGALKELGDVDISSIKKKAYTNFVGNAITRLLGLRGLTWEDLTKFGITKSGKASVTYPKKETAQKQETAAPTKTGAPAEKMPFWDWTSPEGDHYLYAKLGKHFPVEWLRDRGFKPTQKDPKKFWTAFNEELVNELSAQWTSMEA